jgi:oligopeptide transport system substrate-binding protein
MSAWEHNSVITLTKNEAYHGAADVTMGTIKCHLSDDANNMLANFKNGAWLLIDDVPTAEIATLKTEYPTEFVIAGQIGTYYVCWNVNENILPADSTLTGVEAEKAQAEIRNAIGLLFNRQYICDDVAQGGQVPASSFVAMGMTNPDGTEFYKTANGGEAANGFVGYYDASEDALESNYEKAMEVLNKYYK